MKKYYLRLQILTIEQIMAGAQVQMPLETGIFMEAQKIIKKDGMQLKF